MVVINPATDVYSLEISGRIGRPAGLGDIICGWSSLGDEGELVGYFYKRRSGIWGRNNENAFVGFLNVGMNELGDEVYIFKRTHRPPPKIVLRNHYWGRSYSRGAFVGFFTIGENELGFDYPNQIAWRDIFAGGVSTWHGLTTSEKQYYNTLKYPSRQSGFTRFMSKYMSDHRA
jgi:hypothetical protein